MKKISILTTNNMKSKMYFFPLRLHAKKLNESGLSFKYFYKINPEIFDGDQIVLDQKFSRHYWQGRKEEMFKFFSKAKKSCQKLLWFDTTASTSVLEPEALPFVDAYYKGLVLKDLNSYSKPFYSNRIFSDYYHKELSITDTKPPETSYVKSDKDIDKIKLSWNYSLAGHFGIQSRAYNRLRSIFPLPYFYSVKFFSPEKERPVDISCRIALDYGRETISYQRKEIRRLLQERYELDFSRLSLIKYIREIRNSKIVTCPFGWGEITYRDFEVIPCGAALMKPDIDHLETWPPLYIKDKTYISHSWDLSDIGEKIEYYLENRRYTAIAQNAQDLYQRYLYEKKGHDEFVERVLRIFDDRED
ncbi:MAG: glycosyltransferase family 1 protein [Candidatus Aminicenantes bacterium]|nr:MAG: glycosyltransferase family 1 protein [Candidatus Aminicenantes bacterium]